VGRVEMKYIDEDIDSLKQKLHREQNREAWSDYAKHGDIRGRLNSHKEKFPYTNETNHNLNEKLKYMGGYTDRMATIDRYLVAQGNAALMATGVKFIYFCGIMTVMWICLATGGNSL
tara:strand:- start:38 stop:388 length:351 start_codon:yes stop_codon:yes gene_type:complete